jgi:hypothetical protein
VKSCRGLSLLSRKPRFHKQDLEEENVVLGNDKTFERLKATIKSNWLPSRRVSLARDRNC